VESGLYVDMPPQCPFDLPAAIVFKTNEALISFWETVPH